MKVRVILPTYNEAGTIRDVVARALGSTPDVDVLIVDDNSPDGTGDIADGIAAAEPRVFVMHRASKQGLGPAYIAGFVDSIARGYEAMIEMDSDLSHDPADIPRLIEAARAADVVIGSRYVRGGDTQNWTTGRRLMSRGANLYARTLLRFPVRDATAGFRLYRRAVLETIPLDEIHSEGYGFQVEMTWRAWTLGFTIVEIPITFVERREGASKMSRAIAIEGGRKVLRWAAKRARRPAEPHPRSARST
ncbi:MAG: polyprenol monophosphomannose synthase [Actinomycetota bacterium]|nr:polyprenol monophosphomannose synthase [Actinomycetota bacterium]